MARPLQAKIKVLHYTFAPKTATVTQNTKTRHEGATWENVELCCHTNTVPCRLRDTIVTNS